MESSIGSFLLFGSLICGDCWWNSWLQSPMVSRGTVRIESGGGSPPKPAGERGETFKMISKVMCLLHVCV